MTSKNILECCRDCPNRKVTAEYNCHSHCQKYIKARLKRKLLVLKHMREHAIDDTLMESKSRGYKRTTGKKFKQS